MNKKFIIFISIAIITLLSLIGLLIALNFTPNKNKNTTSASPVSTVTEKAYKTAVLGVEQGPNIRIMAVGDIMLGRTIGKRISQDYSKPFSEVKSILANADILFGNLESPISDRGQKTSGKGITFTANPASVKSLSYAGFDVVSVANNHSMDYGSPALMQTIDLLDNEKILHCGAGKNISEARKPAIIDEYGVKIAFLAYTDMYDIYFSKSKFTFEAGENKAGVAPRKLDYIINDIKEAKNHANMVVVSLHWGIEESFDVSEDMIDFAHKLIDSGADVILGHHPHQLQGIEIYKGKPIAYSLGNFIFDQNDDENKESMILDLGYDKTSLVSAKAIPLRILDKEKVIPAPSGKREIIENRLVGLSGHLGTKADIVNGEVNFEIHK